MPPVHLCRSQHRKNAPISRLYKKNIGSAPPPRTARQRRPRGPGAPGAGAGKAASRSPPGRLQVASRALPGRFQGGAGCRRGSNSDASLPGPISTDAGRRGRPSTTKTAGSRNKPDLRPPLRVRVQPRRPFPTTEMPSISHWRRPPKRRSSSTTAWPCAR